MITDIAEVIVARHSGKVWGYTTRSTGHNVLGVNCVPLNWKRGSLSHSADFNKSTTTITLPSDSDLVKSLISASAGDEVTLNIYQITGAANPYQIGAYYVTDVSVTNVQATITCATWFFRTMDNGLSDKYSTICRHSVYSAQCGLNKNTYKRSTTVSSVTNQSLFRVMDIPTFPNLSTANAIGMFNGGEIVINNISRFIDSIDTTGSIFVSDPFPQGTVYAGVRADLYPTCDKYRDTCKLRYNNILNFGGFNHVPIKVN